MKSTTISCASMLLGFAVGCGGGTMATNMDMAGTKTCATLVCTNGQVCNSSTVTCENPTVPTLSGTQIDRVGRPAVNSALTNPFGLYMVNGMAQTTDTTKAAYNADSLPTDWLTNWPTAIKLSLGVFDAIDGVCANQIAYGALTEPNYTLLSQVLAGDALQVDTTQGTCKTYLGVEQAFLGGNIMDCGGRTLTENTIDVTYGALAGPAQPVVNGITTPAVAPLSSFPFLAAPM